MICAIAQSLHTVDPASAAQQGRDCFHSPVESSPADRVAQMVSIVVGAGNLGERIGVLFIEGGDEGDQGVVVGELQSAIEQAERLEAGFHLIHVGDAIGTARGAVPNPLRVAC